MEKLVSIVMPSYKRKTEMVLRAINSLLNQTYTNIEIILVDDNAGDKLRDYRKDIEKLVEKLNDSRIKYIQNIKNLGGSLSRNAGIAVASGELVTFLDDDDKYLSKKIENQVAYLIQNDLDMCFTDLAIYNEKDELIDYREHTDIELFNNDYLFKYHLTKQIAGTSTFLCKKNILLKINGFDDVKMGQEYYLMAKIILSGCKIGYLAESQIVAYRYDIEAISTGPNKISGEKKLYKFKKQYFKILTLKQRRYVRCRHFAVMAVAYKRNRKYFKALINFFISVLMAPILAIKEAKGLIKRRKEKQK